MAGRFKGTHPHCGGPQGFLSRGTLVPRLWKYEMVSHSSSHLLSHFRSCLVPTKEVYSIQFWKRYKGGNNIRLIFNLNTVVKCFTLETICYGYHQQLTLPLSSGLLQGYQFYIVAELHMSSVLRLACVTNHTLSNFIMNYREYMKTITKNYVHSYSPNCNGSLGDHGL